MKVAIVHDYLREFGGAERVVEALHEMFPEAPVYVGLYDAQRLGKHARRFADWDIRETVLARFPGAKRLVSPYRIFSAWAFSQLDLSEYDVVISSTNMYMAKAVRTRADALHISYVHTPPRSLYGHSTMSDWKKNPIIRVGGEIINMWMRVVDQKSAKNPDILLANSTTTQERIRRHYNRESLVVYPPVGMVDVLSEVRPQEKRKYLLYVNRLGFSKHPEIAVQVANHLGAPLKVVGTGAMLENLKGLAGKTVEILGSVDDERLRRLYEEAELLMYPVEDEDFGMIPIEAMAHGTPVIAHYSGEPRFTIKDGSTGVHVSSLDLADWIQATRAARQTQWDYSTIQKSTEPYSQAAFTARIRQVIEDETV